MSSLYAATAVHFNTTVLAGITKSMHDFRYKDKRIGNSGSTHIRTATIEKSAPIINFSTYSVASLLAILNNLDCPCVNLTGAGLVKYSIRGNPNGPGLDSTGHGKAAMATGQAYLNKLSWGIDSYLQADVTAYGVSADGTTNPLVESTIATAFLPVLPEEELLTLVSATYGGTDFLPGLQSLEVNFDHKAKNDDNTCYTGGLPHPTRIVTAGVGGPIEITGSFETNDLSLSIVPTTEYTLAFGFKPFAFGGTLGTVKTLSILLAMVKQDAEDLATASPGNQKFSFVGTVTASTYPWSWTP
jgi:hypothetical protein